MKFLTSPLKKVSLLLGGMMFAGVLVLAAVPARTATQDDSAALYKSKCVACHGATAEKKFDATKADDELIQIVLKGKKLEKPPNMPGYEDKGVTADQAKAVVAYMKSQKQ
ncbi:MAG TPA: cytochrome c [Pyrinomonadaceae bacterium]|nr:cytochrome c [Pyrinomonadaceae bacterium]